jgi:protein-L-isoaspartate(D-aspartate) O-methyltransferase
MNLIESLIEEGWLKTPRIIEAFKKVKRVDFLPENLKDLAELNEALPIGWGQTISQPLVVAFMLELLDPKEEEKILDIGSGSGWTTALLAHIVSGGLNEKLKIKKEKLHGKIIAIDMIPELVEFGKRNTEKYNFVEKGIVEFICADGSKGYQKESPYDKILVSATARECYPSWKEQLKVGGKIVTPIGTSIWLFIKKSEKEFEEFEYPGFVFVPLIEKR